MGSLNQSVMWCLGCGKPVSHQTKTSVKQHVDSQTHQKGKETLKKQKAKREAAATKEKEVPQMRVSTLRQPSLSHVLNIHAERFEVQDDAVFTLLACGIPVEKLNHKIFRAFLRKYTTVEGCLSKTLSPRIEECLKVLKNGENLRTRLLAVVKDLASALEDRLLKEATQLEFFRQMRVLNPANLSDMSTSLADYPLLGLQGVPNVQEDWNVYTRTEKRDIESPEGLVEWWESRQPSALKDAVLFLILLPTSSGAVERFFSMAGTVTDAQHALSDNLRRMRFMAQFNGDIEERLV